MLTRHSRIARIVLIGLMAFMLTVGTSLQAIADDRVEGGLSNSDADVGAEAFVAPPTGYSVTYLFTGAKTSSDTTVVTSVHCTNIGGTVIPLRVEFYSFAGGLVGTGSISLGAYRTATVTAGSSGLSAFYFEDVNVALTALLNQGVVRVLKKGTGKVICTAQVLDAIGSTPSFVISLPHFLPSGAH